MTQWHTKSKRSKTGAIRTSRRRSDKKLKWKGGDAAMTSASDKDKRRKARKAGGKKKVKQLQAKHASVSQKGKKAVKAEIVAVSENKANRLYTRKNIITKGAIITVKIDGKEAKAKVTSRPGQSGTVQAVLQE